jgi:hypothetical protein
VLPPSVQPTINPEGAHIRGHFHHQRSPPGDAPSVLHQHRPPGRHRPVRHLAPASGEAGQRGWPDDLNTLLTARAGGIFTAATPAYLMLSDGAPVCWLTVDGVIVILTLPLTRNQTKHQQQATAALGDLARHALARLADLRHSRDGRRDDIDNGFQPDGIGCIRVANPAEPARAWWIPLGGDSTEAHQRVADTIGCDQPLIITANGYGTYGRDVDRPRLDVLCFINAAATANQVPANVVGDWVATMGGLARLIPASDIAARFAAVYIGRFASQLFYTAFRLDELGWEAALRQMGALEFFDERAFDQHLFTYQVRAFAIDSGRGIAVCRRDQPPAD